jgi:Holliday junction resolvase-like predicted endonuclease
MGRWVLSSEADQFRQDAQECLQKAARSVHADDKERWLRIAQHFLQKAREAEKEHSQSS